MLPKREVLPDVVVVVLPKSPPPVVEVLVELLPNEKADLFWFVFEVLPKRPPVEPVFVEVLPNNPIMIRLSFECNFVLLFYNEI